MIHFRSFKKLAFSRLTLFLVLFCTSFAEEVKIGDIMKRCIVWRCTV